MSFNLVFHVASGFALIILIYALLNLQSQMKFQRMLWQSLNQAQPRVVLDWPHVFLSRFARALNLPLRFESVSLKPVKIKLETWVRAHFELGFIEMNEQPDHDLLIRVRNEADYPAWAKSLELGLGGQVRITIEKFEPVSKGA